MNRKLTNKISKCGYIMYFTKKQKHNRTGKHSSTRHNKTIPLDDAGGTHVYEAPRGCVTSNLAASRMWSEGSSGEGSPPNRARSHRNGGSATPMHRRHPPSGTTGAPSAAVVVLPPTAPPPCTAVVPVPSLPFSPTAPLHRVRPSALVAARKLTNNPARASAPASNVW